MKLRISLLILTVLVACFAEERHLFRNARTPQGHIQYSEPDGNRVNWKLYAPYTQWRSRAEHPQRSQRGESGTGYPAVQSRLVKAEHSPIAPTHYKPYSMVPPHIKDLIYQTYQPQLPYIDPAAYVYQTYPNPEEDKGDEERDPSYQDQYPRSKLKFAQEKKYRQGYIQYKPDHNSRYSSRQQDVSYEQSQHISNAMPNAIQKLLYLQAQTPYHVIANRIVYHPKSVFIPQPIPLDEKNPYKYRTKVYYVKDGNIEPEEGMKPVNENFRQY